ncbi:LLM class flavin-dependent oxidoreductase [Rhodococcus sp. 06-462-5]|uniref:LLM class flavin-dependent oxidoreductase n=1 Tax=unclassified Rhodococcus (in: high G+C Gram-positive bacteria) TaxID=192944 RepID=UPI000B9AD28B|nr:MULTISPECIES: LLM class flavin-dependent oxidoreductase [unclassified Rhodococcus (in: high G+C Gram-positive bacteria)]OZC73633.1 LLM class flavin-dependent oxidoreductase [Rhodococcus sp. 06-462-5]OZE63442.1 LLM class flavin-dependent oxidoreductase [Rhodococcus sp. 02-925g]
MEINCVFPPALATPDHIVLAEELGYQRAWVYDVPVSYADTGATVAAAAARTSTIRLGVSVFTPHLRHIAANAALIAYLATVAPGRFDAGVGAGFTSSTYLGRKPSRWAYIEEYVLALKELLAGREIEWENSILSLMHSPASGISYPIDVTYWIAAHGPKGFGVAQRLGAGVVTNPTHGDNPVPYDGACNLTYYGTVLEDGEALDAPRVLDAAGPGASLALHMGEHGPLVGMPEALGYASAIESVPENRRHLELYRGHLIEPNATDVRFITGDVIRKGTMTGTREDIARTLLRLENAGANAVLYQPAGTDIPRELAAFKEAADLRHTLTAKETQHA